MKKILLSLVNMVLLLVFTTACSRPTQKLTTNTVTPVEPIIQPSASQSVETWKAEEIIAASGPEKCQPVASIPRKLKKEWTLAFINPNRTHPFFMQRDAGMSAAAVFYGARYIGLDAVNGSSYNLLPGLLEKKPDLLGSHNDVLAIAAKAQKENIPFLSVDLMPSKKGFYPYGVPDATAGKLGADLLVEALQERMGGEWINKELFFLGFTAQSIPACVTRTAAAAQAIKDGLKLDDAHVLIIDPNVEKTTAEKVLLLMMTDHPQAVFGLIPCWDQLGIDPYKAVAAAGYESRLLLVTLGGDKSNLEFLKTKPVGYYGLVEFQPYCEGWSWIETALAILVGVPFEPYQVSRTVTQAGVEARYAELYGTGK